MKIHLWSVGKHHDSYVKQGVEEFTQRISKYYPVDWKVIPAARQTVNTSEADVKSQEAQNILSLLTKDDFLALLDEKGKMLSSVELAGWLQQRANQSTRNLIFLIGGAFGVEDSITARANFKWSLSALVFPHQLVRLILTEQVYRACTINRNEKYHHT